MRAAAAACRARISSAPGTVSAPSRTITRPATTVCRAAVGPQRSQASTGSVERPGERQALLRPAHQVPGGADAELADLPGPAEAPGAAAGADVEHLPRGHARGPEPLPAEQQRRPGLQPQRGGVRGRGSVAAEPDRAAGRAQFPHRRETAAGQQHVRAGAVRHPDARRAEPGRLRLVRVDAVRHPGPRGQPADLLVLLDRPAAEVLQAVGVLVRVLGQVGVQPHVEALGQFRGAPHQLRADAERGARGQRDPHHGPPPGVVVRGDQALAVGEDLVVVLHHRVRRQPAVLDRDRHRAAGRVEPQAHLARGGDLRRPQVAAPRGCHVQVVGAGGAAAQGQFGQGHPGGQVRRLLVQARPQRVQAGQPLEQGAVHRRRVRPGQVLVHVVVGVDQARRDQAAGGVQRLPRGRPGVGRAAHRADQPAGDGDPAAGQFPPLRVTGSDQLGTGDHQVGAGPGGHHWCSGSPSGASARDTVPSISPYGRSAA